MTVEEIALRFREEVARREGRASRALVDAYLSAERAIVRELLELLREIAEDPALERAPNTLAMLYRRGRLERLLQAVSREMRRLGVVTVQEVGAAQAEVVALAGDHTQQLAEAQSASISQSWTRMPQEATERLVGLLGDGTPLDRVIQRYPAAAQFDVRNRLVEGLALGRNPRDTARRMATAISAATPMPDGGPSEVVGALQKVRNQALVTARTETIRAYRGAAGDNFRRNSDVLEGWIWLSALDLRTCPVCWAMHGEIFEVGEIMGSHPQCRCTPVPLTLGRTLEDLGMRLGGAEFASLLPDQQERILGPGKLALYRSGEISLRDLVVRFDDPDWGPERREASIERALRQAAERRAA